MLGVASAPVLRLTALRAVTASADGSSKSFSLPSSPKTGSAKTAATSTSTSAPQAIARLRRKITAPGIQSSSSMATTLSSIPWAKKSHVSSAVTPASSATIPVSSM